MHVPMFVTMTIFGVLFWILGNKGDFPANMIFASSSNLKVTASDSTLAS